MNPIEVASYDSRGCGGGVRPRLYTGEKDHSRVEAGSNTSTVTLRVVGGDEKELSNLRQ
jgi:hypothetical protein